jgi:hypothetical protein
MDNVQNRDSYINIPSSKSSNYIPLKFPTHIIALHASTNMIIIRCLILLFMEIAVISFFYVQSFNMWPRLCACVCAVCLLRKLLILVFGDPVP